MYIKINTSVNLSSGLTIPSGSVVTIAEGYADVKSEADGIIPAQVATFLYASEAAMQGDATPVQGVADFNPVFSGLELTFADWESVPAQTLLIDAVKGSLVAVYGEANVEVVA